MMIGRVSLEVSNSEGMLPIVLGPTERWRDLQQGQGIDQFLDSRGKRAKSTDSKSDFSKLQRSFRCSISPLIEALSAKDINLNRDRVWCFEVQMHW